VRVKAFANSDSRPEYQRLLALIRQGAVAGVAAYDDSRLNRNAENALALYRECAARGSAGRARTRSC
jgi:DNA invertase Pin-like site-specific DNA recombinase